MRLEYQSLTAHRYTFPSAVGCSAMSVNHAIFGAVAANFRPTNKVVVHRWTRLAEPVLFRG